MKPQFRNNTLSWIKKIMASKQDPLKKHDIFLEERYIARVDLVLFICKFKFFYSNVKIKGDLELVKSLWIFYIELLIKYLIGTMIWFKRSRTLRDLSSAHRVSHSIQLYELADPSTSTLSVTYSKHRYKHAKVYNSLILVKICDERSYFWQFCWTRSINSQEPDLVHIIWHHSTCVLRGFGLTEMPSRLNSVPYNNNDCLNTKTQIIKFYILAVSYFVHAALVQSYIAIIKMS